MSRITRLSFLILVLFYFSAIGIAMAGDAVSFSGVVKKVIADKNKVGIKDPETKKRFTKRKDMHRQSREFYMRGE